MRAVTEAQRQALADRESWCGIIADGRIRGEGVVLGLDLVVCQQILGRRLVNLAANFGQLLPQLGKFVIADLDRTGLVNVHRPIGAARLVVTAAIRLIVFDVDGVLTDGSLFIDRWSSLETPPSVRVCKGNGTVLRELGQAESAALDEYAVGTWELLQIPARDGYLLDAALLAAVVVDWRRAARAELELRRLWPEMLAQGVATEVQLEVPKSCYILVELLQLGAPLACYCIQRSVAACVLRIYLGAFG